MAVSDYLPDVDPDNPSDPLKNTEEDYNEVLRAELILRRKAVSEEITAMVAGTAGGSPDARLSDIEHVAWLKAKHAELDSIDALLTKITPPSEVVVHGYF